MCPSLKRKIKEKVYKMILSLSCLITLVTLQKRGVVKSLDLSSTRKVSKGGSMGFVLHNLCGNSVTFKWVFDKEQK